jgi:hypothetical protein
MRDYFEGRALDRVLDKRERGKSGYPSRKPERMNKWAKAFLVFAIGVFLVSIGGNGKVEPRHGAALTVQKKQ